MTGSRIDAGSDNVSKPAVEDFELKYFRTMNQRISIALLAVYWAAMIVGTHIPAEHVPYMFSWADKLAHFFAYGGLAVLIVNAFGFQGTMKFGMRAVGGLILLLLVHGALDEVTQSFIPGRVPAIADWIADGLGGAVGVAACRLWAEWAAGRHPSADLSTH